MSLYSIPGAEKAYNRLNKRFERLYGQKVLRMFCHYLDKRLTPSEVSKLLSKQDPRFTKQLVYYWQKRFSFFQKYT